MAVFLAFGGGMLLERHLLSPRDGLVRLDEAGMDSLEAAFQGGSGSSEAAHQGGSYYAVAEQQPETFPFDPNTADSTALLRLGLAPWQVRAIYKYRARGGRYHRVEDFKRVPGMAPEVWERLSGFVQIGEAFRYYERAELDRERGREAASSSDSSSLANSSSSSSSSSSFSFSAPAYPRQDKFTELVQLDLNIVDTTTLKRVPGIASYRARQIVRYRDRLGGYASVEQLSEIEGLPLELQAWFKVESGIYRKLKVNSAAVGELARHPYIGSARAKAIINYRRTQGRIQSLSDLRLLPDFSQEDLQRLSPYVEY